MSQRASEKSWNILWKLLYLVWVILSMPDYVVQFHLLLAGKDSEGDWKG